MTARRNAFAGVPFTRLLGVRREFSEAGRARLVVDARPELQNVIGAMHGGIVATLLDVAMASAAVSKVDFEMTAAASSHARSARYATRRTVEYMKETPA
jgi:uncharacterized protein (TIGR00369 family)